MNKAQKQRIITIDEFYEYIDWIEIFDALEIHKVVGEGQKTDLLIPYLMNDAVESVLRVHNCTFSQGEENEMDFSHASILQMEDTDDLVLDFGNQLVAVHYEELSIETKCYQYHNIGHMWRKEPGEEHLRRLVNLACIIYDKYRYLGDEFTNEMERELAPLIEFGPFAQWSPINSSMLEWYSETADGLAAMKKIVLEAEDAEYYKLLCQYEAMEPSSQQRKMQYRILTGELVSSEHWHIYQTILRKIEKASKSWDIRDYGQEINQKIAGRRATIEERYRAMGFEGSYPHFQKYNLEDDSYSFLHFVEQPTFTMLESEGYPFRIFAMESSGNSPQQPCRDYGFFHENDWTGSLYEVE